MTNYEKILTIEKDFLELINRGFIPTNALHYKVLYEAYLAQIDYNKKKFEAEKKEEAVMTVAAQNDIGRRTMYRVIKFMEAA